MALSIGTIKQMSGLVMAKNSQGEERVLKVGDTVFFEDNIRTIGAGSHIVLGLNNGQEIVLDGNDAVFLDKSVYVAESFGEEAVVAGKTMDNVVSGKSVEELQAALLEGKDINELQPTAAGEGGATVGGEMSTNAMARYVTGGNESNVVADYRTIGGTGAGDVTYTAPTGAVTPIVNTPPLGSDLEVITKEDTSITSALPVATDADGNAITYALADATTNGTVVVNADGTYTYTPNENYNGPDSFTYTINDGNGGENTYTVFINVTPVNDPAILSSATVSLDETNAVLSTGGTLTVTDVDDGEAAYVAQTNVAGTYGTFSIAADGTWSYVANESYDSLNAGDTISDTFSVASIDGTTSSVQVTIVGTNDTAILSSATVSLDETNAVLSTGGTLTVTDVDDGEAAYVAQTNVAGTYGTFSIAADGTWSYVANESYDSLNAGDTISDTFSVASIDGTTSSVQVTIVGTNDTAILSSATVSLDETNAVLTTGGTLTVTDVDDGEAAYVAQTNVAGTYGTFSIAADGTWSYVANESYDSLNAGDTISDTFSVASIDGTTSSVQVTIVGTNDTAILSSATVSLDETNAVLTTGGTLTVTDVDDGEAAYVAQTNVAGTYGTFSIAADGTWSYVANESYDSLNAGDTISDTFSVASIDGTTSSVTVNIIGTNDGPMAESKVFTTAEDTPIIITDAQLLANATDIDSNDILSINNVTLVDNANGTLIDNHNGTYTFIPSTNYSGSGIEFMFTVTDTSGMTDTQDVTINVTPVNDAPTLIIDTGNLNNASDIVSESALSIGTNPSSDGEFAYGQFTISDPEGLSDIQSLTLGTTQFTVGAGGLADLVGSSINTTNGVVTLTGYSNGIFDYTFELKTPTINVPNQLETNSFLVQVKDSAGVSNSPTEVIINIIDDDTPIVKDYTITSDGSVTIGTVNLVIILDRSGSMADVPSGTTTTRLALAQEAIENLITAYGQNLNSVMALSFSDPATYHGWMSGSNAVTTFNALTANGNTDYDHALSLVQTNYGTPSAADHTYVYFLSDGAPTGTDGTNANSVNAAEHTAWVNFLTTHGIDKVFAVGIGEDITSNQALSHLDTVAWSATEPNQTLTWNALGVVNPTTTHNVNTLVAADPTDLSAILIGTVDIQDGNIVTDTNSGSIAGADGWGEKTLVSLSYDGTNDGIDNPTVYTFPTSNTEHTIVFGGERGSLTIAGDGTYTYTPSENPDGTPFYLTYTAQDSDGSVSLPAKLWIDVNDAPIAHSDNVITNIFTTNFTIPGHLLAVNDTDSDGDRLSAPDVSVATGWTKGADFTASAVQTIDFDAHQNNNNNKFVELDRSDFSKTAQPANTATLVVDGYLDSISSGNNDEDVLTVALNANEVLTLDHNLGANEISMEYREGTSGAWTSIADGNSFTALSDGDYQVRIVNTDDNGSSGGGTGAEDYLLTLKIDYSNAEGSTPLVNGTYEVSDGYLSDDGAFTLNYQSGSDLNGTDGDDILIGGSGSDTIHAGIGNDALDGGDGNDALYGGADNDTLVYDHIDTVSDGGIGVDTLLAKDAVMDFSAIDDAKIENIEVLDLSKADVSIINLNPNDVFDITDNASTILKIIGDSDDSVASTITGGDSPWAVVADQTGVDDGFTRYEGTLDDGVTKVMVDIQDTIVHTDFD